MDSTAFGTHLSLRNLSKTYSSLPVLKAIDLEVKPGEFVAIVGRSGCGKSTLLRLIAGLETASDGEVFLDGEILKGLNTTTAVRVMFQDARLLPWKQVIENVQLGLPGGRRKSAEYALQQVGLLDRAGEWPAILSGGQRQRVALARALASQPRLLLLDEPLGALDALTRIEMQRLIESLWQEQQFTTLLITHDVEEAVALADRVILIEAGRIAMDLPVSLPRPRRRGNATFAALVEQVLDRVVGRREGVADLVHAAEK
ncbi:ATP-binding cassette domain-containing protein [Leptolyngbya sp. FACHB-261]|uniref:ATP-binding cassette domain-containing protein n=1 Tax=Leptolyngbya sp. FACHB-261 TaxID=2692806 RepID=UPI001689841D|nr:ATP-binding cassette domain-containing protein [Leptolyngbya sp. FACHB-261]MBD2102981.1 ATP-binding cassette domain-containing protein [Leptolyngbya sp. FACHB-261]